MRLAALSLLCSGLLAPASAAAQTPGDGCRELTASPRPLTDRGRAPRAEDLITLTDIGDPAPTFESAGLSLSPDGRYLAFPIRRAALASNGYCLGLVLLDLSGKRRPILLDTSAELVLQDFNFRGPLVPGDYPVVVRPRWSPDGQWVAYQKSVGGVTQLWRARTDGAEARPIDGTVGLSQDFLWSDNDTVIVASRAGLAEAEQAIAREAPTGFRYDERFLPMQSDRPYPMTPKDSAYRAVSITSGRVRPASNGERALLEPTKPDGAVRVASGKDGAIAWTFKVNPDRHGSNTDLQVRFPGRSTLSCGPDRCDRIDGLWWSPGQERLVFVRREGWAKSRTGVYVWRRDQAAPTRILVTDDLLSACQIVGDALLCGHESALQPRQVVRIRLRDGRMQVIYDPNPAFSRLTLGRVERLHWTNANGFETYGDLVYPTTFQPGRKYPTIVTTYTTRGFLRGATGDEYPIQLFANSGYAVLSFARPMDVGVNMKGVPDIIAASRIAFKDWADRHSVQSSIEGGLRLLDQRKMLDRSKVGITGFSDGASTVQFALLNSALFAAAAISNCCVERETALAGIGVQNADHFRMIGFPRIEDHRPDFWGPMSLAMNAQHMRTPLLMQLGSAEFRMALSSYAPLREHGQPVDMYVFADEGHVKLQPAHRLAVYQRSLAWFDFWLKGEKDYSLVAPGELSRWEAWRSSAGSERRSDGATGG